MPPLLDGRTNASFGVRAFDGYTSHSFLFVLGNKGVTFACNVLFNVYLHDIMTCHKMIRTDVFRSLPLRSAGFAIEPEITARLVQRGERIFEVPVHYRARATDEGKKLTALDGFRVLGTLLRCRFSERSGCRSGGGSGRSRRRPRSRAARTSVEPRAGDGFRTGTGAVRRFSGRRSPASCSRRSRRRSCRPSRATTRGRGSPGGARSSIRI